MPARAAPAGDLDDLGVPAASGVSGIASATPLPNSALPRKAAAINLFMACVLQIV
jgi:hypothetical protein